MAIGTPKWVKFRSWSGISIRGVNRYSVPSAPNACDVVVAACTRPEGGAYDTVVSYDGTALTWGLVQWTFTSGRLQKLLKKLWVEVGDSSTSFSSVLFALAKAGLKFDSSRGELVKLSNNLVVKNKSQLRDMLTPPAGQVPSSGPKFELAKSVAIAFAEFGQSRDVARAQEKFFLGELSVECGLKRPMMNRLSIDFYLGDPNVDTLDECMVAARALFWSMWQNGPRPAESHMHKALAGKPFTGKASLLKLASSFAKSTYGFWGNAKCAALKDASGKPTPRESRYHKVASEINEVMASRILDPDLR